MEEQQPEKTTAETTTQQTLLYQMEHKYFCPEDEDRSTEETYILDIVNKTSFALEQNCQLSPFHSSEAVPARLPTRMCWSCWCSTIWAFPALAQ